MKVRKKMTVISAGATVALTAALFGAGAVSAKPAQAWSSTGCQMPDRFMTWAIWGEYSAHYETITRIAAGSWAASTILSSRQYINMGPADIGVEVEDFGNTDWAGRAPEAFDCGSGIHDWQTVQINHFEHQTATIEEKRSTIAHEFGHAVGLAHPPNQVESMPCAEVSLMNHYWAPRSNCDVYTPQGDDIEGVNWIYALSDPCDDCGPVDIARIEERDATAPPNPSATPSVLDFVRTYDSLEALEADASDVVVVEPTVSSRVEYIGGSLNSEPTPFTVTTARVTGVLSGDLAVGDMVEVRQFGDDAEYAVNAAPLLREGSEYLLYLKPWERISSAETGQHVIVGGQAAWQLSGESGTASSGQTDLPERIALDGASANAVASD